MRLNKSFLEKRITYIAFVISLCTHLMILLAVAFLCRNTLEQNSLPQKIAEFEQLLATMPLLSVGAPTVQEPEVVINAALDSNVDLVMDVMEPAESPKKSLELKVPETDVRDAVYKALKHWKLEKIAVKKKQLVSSLKLHNKNNKAATTKKAVPSKQQPTKLLSKSTNNSSNNTSAKLDPKNKNNKASNQKSIQKKATAQAVQKQADTKTNSSNIKDIKNIKKGESFPLTDASYNPALNAYIPAKSIGNVKLFEESNARVIDTALSKTVLDIVSLATSNTSNIDTGENDSVESAASLMNIRFTDRLNSTAELQKAHESQLKNLSAAEVEALKRHYMQLTKAIQDISSSFNEQLELPAHVDTDSVPELEVTIDAEGSCARVLIAKSSGLLIKDLAFKRVALSLKYPQVLKGRTFTLYFAAS